MRAATRATAATKRTRAPSPPARREAGRRTERRRRRWTPLVGLAGPDVRAALDRNHEDAAVADFAGARRGRDGRDRRLDELRGHHRLDHGLGQQVDVVFGAAVGGRVALLAAVAAHFRHRQAWQVELLERGGDVIDLGGPHDGHYEFHEPSWSRRSRSTLSAWETGRGNLAAD